MIRIGLVGLGLIGQERVRAVVALREAGHDIDLDCCYDPYVKAIGESVDKSDATVVASLDDIIARRPDLVVVAVPHNVAPDIAKHLLRAGLRVLVEKPLGRSLDEARAIVACATRSDQLWVGQNYRFFEGIARMLEDLRVGWFGRPIELSMVMGHGGSPRDRESWKLDPVRAGGGALIDPGIHLLDLCRLAAGPLEFIGGTTWDGFWKTGIEEECRVLLRGCDIPMIDLTISVVRWRSTFRMELFGEDGYGIVTGRGRSYGPQEYRRGRRWGWQTGKPQADTEELVVSSAGEDTFASELAVLMLSSKSPGSIYHPCNVDEAIENMRILDAIRTELNLH